MRNSGRGCRDVLVGTLKPRGREALASPTPYVTPVYCLLTWVNRWMSKISRLFKLCGNLATHYTYLFLADHTKCHSSILAQWRMPRNLLNWRQGREMHQQHNKKFTRMFSAFGANTSGPLFTQNTRAHRKEWISDCDLFVLFRWQRVFPWQKGTYCFSRQ